MFHLIYHSPDTLIVAVLLTTLSFLSIFIKDINKHFILVVSSQNQGST